MQINVRWLRTWISFNVRLVITFRVRKWRWDGMGKASVRVCVCMLKNTEKNAKKGELHICMHEKRKYI